MIEQVRIYLRCRFTHFAPYVLRLGVVYSLVEISRRENTPLWFTGLYQQVVVVQQWAHIAILSHATFGLRLDLRLFEKTNNDVTTTTLQCRIHCCMSVHHERDGQLVVEVLLSKSLSSFASNRAHGRGRRRVVKSSFSSLYELTRHIIALAPHACL